MKNIRVLKKRIRDIPKAVEPIVKKVCWVSTLPPNFWPPRFPLLFFPTWVRMSVVFSLLFQTSVRTQLYMMHKNVPDFAYAAGQLDLPLCLSNRLMRQTFFFSPPIDVSNIVFSSHPKDRA